jgi:hypothetical protein
MAASGSASVLGWGDTIGRIGSLQNHLINVTPPTSKKTPNIRIYIPFTIES